MRHLSFLLLACTWNSCVISAAEVEFDIQPRALRVGEVAICSLTVRGIVNPPAPTLPAISGFKVSSVGTERSWSFGTGGQTSAVTFRFQLLPLQAGKFTIGPFTYQAGGQTFQLTPIEVTVVEPDIGPTPGTGTAGSPDLLFARLSAVPATVYIQQVFDLQLSLYSRGINLGREVSLINLPSAGLSLKPFQELPGTREVVNHQIYDVRRFLCRAQALTAGRFELAPTVRVHVVVPRERRRRLSPFDDFFGDSFFSDSFFGAVQTQPVDLSVQPVAITVQPWPLENQPAGYAGAVGRFAFDVQVRPSEVRVGEPVTLTLQISGEGNIENVAPPALAAGPEFRVYEPRLVTRDISGSQPVGRLLYEQVVIPKSEKAPAIPALSFSYLDPVRGEYEVITRGPFPLTVHPDTNVAARLVTALPGQPEARTLILGSDIVYLKSLPARWRRTEDFRWFTKRGFVVAQVLPLVAVLGVFLAVRRREEMTRDLAKARRLRAPRSARPAFRRAEQALARGSRRDYVEALWQAMAAYFANRLNLAAGAVTPDIVLERLRGAALGFERLDALRALLTFCEQERYGLGPTGDAVFTEEERRAGAERLETLRQVLKACERMRL